MHLRDRCGGQRLPVEALENGVDGLAVGGLQDRDGLFRRERRYRVLQFRQLVGDVRRQQVAARRNRLAELDEDRAQLFQCEANALASRGAAVAAPWREVEEKAQRAQQVRRGDELIEAVLDQDPLDADQPEEGLAPHHRVWSRSRLTLAASRSTSSRSSLTRFENCSTS